MATTLHVLTRCTCCGEQIESLGQCASCGRRAFTHIEQNGPDAERNRRSSEAIWHCRAQRCPAGGHVIGP